MLRAAVQGNIPKADVHAGLNTIDRNRSFAVDVPEVRDADFAAIRNYGPHQCSQSTAGVVPDSDTPHCSVNSRRWYTAQLFEVWNDR